MSRRIFAAPIPPPGAATPTVLGFITVFALSVPWMPRSARSSNRFRYRSKTGDPVRAVTGQPRDANQSQSPDQQRPERNDASRAERTESSTAIQKPSGSFVLRSSAVKNDGVLPKEFTGDGDSISPPLEWSGAPPETKSYAVIMHHNAPDMLKWYWVLYNIPTDVTNLPKNVKSIGTVGNNSVNNRGGYAPPHSKGPGAKTYILTVYALSAPPQITVHHPRSVARFCSPR